MQEDLSIIQNDWLVIKITHVLIFIKVSTYIYPTYISCKCGMGLLGPKYALNTPHTLKALKDLANELYRA